METQSNLKLAGKSVIILGGSTGIGFATAQAAVTEGAQVTIVSGNQQRITEALNQLPKGSKGFAIDLSHEQNIVQLFEQTDAFDHLVYTAGENISLSPIADTEIENARKFWGLRYWSALAAVKYAAPKINAGGSIVLTGGIAGARPGAGWGIAASICGAIEGFTRAMAVELAPIRVNLVAPGVVKTNLWDSMSEADRANLYESVGNALPVKRVGEAADIAKTYIYLMTQAYGTGQSIIVDGGNVLV